MKIIGLIERIKIKGKGGSEEVDALVDTGAKLTSIDYRLAESIKPGPPVRTFKVKAPALKRVTKRPVVRVIIEIAGKRFETEANLSDRSHMKYPVIIGRNILYGNFMVDVSKSPKNIRE
jgi:hypothetical protein